MWLRVGCGGELEIVSNSLSFLLICRCWALLPLRVCSYECFLGDKKCSMLIFIFFPQYSLFSVTYSNSYLSFHFQGLGLPFMPRLRTFPQTFLVLKIFKILSFCLAIGLSSSLQHKIWAIAIFTTPFKIIQFYQTWRWKKGH